jgi:type I restriction enzyme M protein
MSDVAGVIKFIRNTMRKDAGISGDAQRIDQTAWILFLKIFDDREQEIELLDISYRSPIPKDFRWRTWAANEQGITGDALLSFVDGELFPAMQQLHQEHPGDPRARVISSVFDGANNFMKNGTLLRQVINKVQEIDFNDSGDRHKFGDLYEALLRELQSAGDAGEFYTPRAVTEFMVEMVDPKLGETVIDPAAGTGGFLTSTVEHVRSNYVNTPEDEAVLQEHLLGVEKKHLPHILCVTNMFLHGIDVPSSIRHDNTLARPLIDWSPAERVDVVVTNPPFGGTEEDGIENNFPADVRTRETADLFLVLIMHLLKSGGRSAIVLPDGTLFGEGVKTIIKEKLLTECNLHTVVRLPGSVFAPYTDIATNLLFFEKGEPTTQVWFYEHRIPEGQKAYSKTKPIRLPEFDVLKGWWGDRKETEQAWLVSVDQIRERNFNLDISNPNVVEKELRDPDEVLAEYRAVLGTLDELTERLAAELGTSLKGAAG